MPVKQRLSNQYCKSLLISGEVSERHCLIVDDIIDSGQTIKQAAKVLRDLGAKSVKACVTHGVFSLDAHISPQTLGLDQLTISSSVPTNHQMETIEKVEVAKAVAQSIQNVMN